VEGPRTGRPSAKGSARLHRQADSRGRRHAQVTLHRVRLDGLDLPPISHLLFNQLIEYLFSHFACVRNLCLFFRAMRESLWPRWDPYPFKPQWTA
jgi:hypothetical protein